MVRVAVLDDYQNVALKMADWSSLPAGTRVEVFSDHLHDIEAVAERLREFEVVVAMRERTPFQRDLLEKLPRLELLVTTGNQNAADRRRGGARAGRDRPPVPARSASEPRS